MTRVRVSSEDECYFRWDHCRRQAEKLTHAKVEDKITTEHVYKEERGDRVRGARVTHENTATTVQSKSEAFREDYDEGYFYKLDDRLTLHAALNNFKNLANKVKGGKLLGTRL